MTNLFQALNAEAEGRLVKNDMIELLRASVEIEPDPENPDDNDAMKETIRVYDSFVKNISWLNDEISQIRNLCEDYDQDFDNPARMLLKSALFQKKNIQDEAAEWVQIRQILAMDPPKVAVWAFVWRASMDDEGKINVSCYGFFNEGVMDSVTLPKVQKRIMRVNERMDKVIRKLMSGK